MEENSPIPESHSSNPGLFLTYQKSIPGEFAVTSGLRVDWHSANIDDEQEKLDGLGTLTPQPSFEEIVGANDFDRDFSLFPHLLLRNGS